MSKAFFSESGKAVFGAFSDDCPCGCPSFEGRSICYVDKKATGTGGGSSWANAYTDIQTAINAHPKKEIQIKGYSENDCYPAGIILAECVYLKGIDDVWIDGGGGGGIDGNNFATTRIENLRFTGCNVGVRNVGGYIENCEVKNSPAGDSKYGFIIAVAHYKVALFMIWVVILAGIIRGFYAIMQICLIVMLTIFLVVFVKGLDPPHS